MNNFILESSIKDLSICDDLISFHKDSPSKKRGKVQVSSENSLVHLESSDIKLSTDVFLPDGELAIKYFNELNVCAGEYVNKYFYSAHYEKWNVLEEINIQHYLPKEGYFKWHTERGLAVSPNNNRHLVFMTYLNDVEDGGETEFFYQNIKIKPKKGKTLIWPADWTHTHRGITSLTQEKYIITGWFSYC